MDQDLQFEENGYYGDHRKISNISSFLDVDDLAFRPRNDPNFIASISNFVLRNNGFRNEII